MVLERENIFNFKGKGKKSQKKMKVAIRGPRNKDRKVGELSVLIKSGEIKATLGETEALWTPEMGIKRNFSNQLNTRVFYYSAKVGWSVFSVIILNHSDNSS